MEGSGSSASDDFSDTIFWFLHENCPSSENFSGVSSEDMHFAVDDDEEEENEWSLKAEENRVFWDTQDQLLQATLCRTSSIESRIRQATKEALTASELLCSCRRSAAPGGCRSCLRKEISAGLCNSGYDCSVRKSKWRSSSDIPSGEHSYLEVVLKKKGGEAVRVIVELHFRSEFEMARAGEEYERLVRRLPEVFVGKAERLRGVVKIMCGAAKKCMKEKKMHLGPWRKHKYMLAKWLSGPQLSAAAPESEPEAEAAAAAVGKSGGRAGRPRASMLTFALVERPHCQAVAVV